MLSCPLMPSSATPRTPFGIEGLDRILHGGIPRHTLFLCQGPPGSGKTTLSIQFLMEGARTGERCLLVTNGETANELDQIALSHGWNLEGIEVVEWQEPHGDVPADTDAEYTLFPEVEVEVGETLARLFSAIEEVAPDRLVIDSIATLRAIAPTPGFYRRQVKRIHDVLVSRACTTVMIDDVAGNGDDARAQTLAHGMLELEHVDFRYGADRRRLRVRKVRGSVYQSGSHDFVIERGGLRVYPRLVAGEHVETPLGDAAASGLAALDELAGGGLTRGSSTLIMGPAGTGKSTLASLYVHAAAQRGERCTVQLFDESLETFLRRSRGLGMEMRPFLEDGRLRIAHLDPAELTPGQIAHRLVEHVEQEDARLVVIDSLNGYLESGAEEPMVLLHLRELLSYLSRRGVVTILPLTQHGVIGPNVAPPVDVSFLADNVFVLRYLELRGKIRQTVSMLKKRAGAHERTVRELHMEPGRVTLSGALDDLSGVLAGVTHPMDPSGRPPS